jgi:hypothetical protein
MLNKLCLPRDQGLLEYFCEILLLFLILSDFNVVDFNINMKHYSPTVRRNHDRPLKRLLDT